MLTDLLDKKLEFILFGGKGGVGKTTMAASSAVMFAKKHPKKKVLVFTTDPAPSLSDSFAQKVSSVPTKIDGFENLWALEIDANKELEDFKKVYGADILNILQEGTYLSDEETEDMFSLDIPGLDEVMGLKKITDFMSSGEFDYYILDTAPTGHTLRLLTLPDLLDDWIKFMANLRWKYHAMVKQFSRGKEKRVEKADEFLLEMKRSVKRVQELLQDSSRTTFVAVAIPEAMSVEETKDLVDNLTRFKIPISHVIVNNVVPIDDSDFLIKRRESQMPYIAALTDSFPSFTITQVELQAGEIRGLDSLAELGNNLF
jgi:arsenite/tail-anchored protein-transporting ATPase